MSCGLGLVRSVHALSMVELLDGAPGIATRRRNHSKDRSEYGTADICKPGAKSLFAVVLELKLLIYHGGVAGVTTELQRCSSTVLRAVLGQRMCKPRLTPPMRWRSQQLPTNLLTIRLSCVVDKSHTEQTCSSACRLQLRNTGSAGVSPLKLTLQLIVHF